VTAKLLAELEHQTDHPELCEQLESLVLKPGDDEDPDAAKERARRAREAFAKARPARVSSRRSPRR
jgi:hypothetical protein